MMRTLPWIAVLALLGACEPQAYKSPAPESLQVEQTQVPTRVERVAGKEDLDREIPRRISQVGSTQVPRVINPYFAGEGGAPEESPTPAETSSSSEGSFNLEPDVWNPNAFKRLRRRMNIDQLDRAIKDATGGIGWVSTIWPYDGNQFDVLRPTLGVPDWYTRVVEDLTANLVFQKFLSDASTQVCANLIAQEWNAPPESRVFLVHIEPTETPHLNPDKAALNMKMLLLRFHGKSYSVDGSGLVPWLWLVDSTSLVTDSNIEVWRAVCLALINHPDFYSY